MILFVCHFAFIDVHGPHPLTQKEPQCMETVVSVTQTYAHQKKGHCVDQTLLLFYQYIQFHINASLSDCPLGLIDGDSSHILIWKTHTKYKNGGCTAYTFVLLWNK